MSRDATDSISNAVSGSSGIDAASARLRRALDMMEGRLPQLLDRLSRSETQLSESSGMASDRAQLAARLDEVTARANALETERDRIQAEASANSQRIDALTARTRTELDTTIATLRDMLGG